MDSEIEVELGCNSTLRDMSGSGLGCVKTQVLFSKVEILTQLQGFRSDKSS
jgi:hypothetical protein